MALQLIPIPAFQDNYIWLMRKPQSSRCWVVDPGDAEPVASWLAANDCSLEGILLTHHHPDHTGGVEALLNHWQIPVYGPVSKRIPWVSNALADGDSVTACGQDFKVLAVPGHTLDHIAYYGEPKADAPLLLCGDTLFAGGCGRMFEGDAEMMHNSLMRLAALPADTRVYCAHEYTLANLRFAQAAEPGNAVLGERVKRDRKRLEREGITLPSTMYEERETNPFLRCHKEVIKTQAEQHAGHTLHQPTEVFAALRQWKDRF